MTTAEEIELLISRLGVLFWQLDSNQEATIDSYEQRLNQLIWGNLNYVVPAESGQPEAHCTVVSLSRTVCPII